MKPTLIIVDDDRLARAEIRRALETDFHIVGEAANGEVGLALCREHHPDIVLMDVVMPHVSGIEAARRMVTEFAIPPKIIFLSGLSDEHIILEAMDAGGTEFLVKPVSPEILRQAVLAQCLKAAA